MSPQNKTLKNDTLKLLEELDSEDEEKKSEEFRYLGVHMPLNGSWNGFRETKKRDVNMRSEDSRIFPLL